MHIPPRLVVSAALLALGTAAKADVYMEMFNASNMAGRNIVGTHHMNMAVGNSAFGKPVNCAWSPNDPVCVAAQHGRAAQAAPASRSGHAAPAAGTAAPAVKPGATTFEPTADSVLPATLVQKVAKTSEDRAKLEQTYSNYLNGYKISARRRGWAPNDVAPAMAEYVQINYAIGSGKPVTPTQAEAVHRQTRRALASNPKFQQMKDAQRQRLYEEMAMYSAMMAANYSKAREAGDTAKAQRMQQVARKNLENFFGVPLAKIRVTDEGAVF